MTRILKITEKINIENAKQGIKLTIEDEHENDLQGSIYIDDINRIEIPQRLRKQENKEYYVYNPAENKPKKIYTNYEEALVDAKDVASKYSNCKIHVLEIVSTVTRTSETKEVVTEHGNVVNERTIENEEIPF